MKFYFIRDSHDEILFGPFDSQKECDKFFGRCLAVDHDYSLEFRDDPRQYCVMDLDRDEVIAGPYKTEKEAQKVIDVMMDLNERRIVDYDWEIQPWDTAK